MIAFGPGGNPSNFPEKSSLDMPRWLNSLGLNAYEYQCNRGVNISKEKAKQLGENAKENGVLLSVHGSYFVSLSSTEKDKRDNSIGYIMETLEIAHIMGATRVVIHPGSDMFKDRKKSFEVACETMDRAIKEAKSRGLDDVYICPETMGKINQLGSPEEIIEMCKIDKMLLPAIDFGHVHTRGMGCLNTQKDFEELLDKFINGLGYERMKNFHSHFSKIEFTKGGEKKHKRIIDEGYGPDFNLLAPVLKSRQLEPMIICESEDYMADDALLMQSIYNNV
jgi:deoxyribonuclease-4